MVRMLRGVAVTLSFLAGALAITLVCATTLFGVPTADLPAVGVLLLGVGGAGWQHWSCFARRWWSASEACALS
jgi:hypothetical protein